MIRLLLLISLTAFFAHPLEAQSADTITIKAKKIQKINELWYSKKTNKPLQGTYRLFGLTYIAGTAASSLPNIEVVTFDNGVPVGNYVGYYSYEKKTWLHIKGQFNGGKKMGEWLLYCWDSPEVEKRMSFVDDKLDGTCIEYYYRTTKIKEHAEYENGKLLGQLINYDYDGSIRTKFLYGKQDVVSINYKPNDKGVDTIYYENKKLKKAVHYTPEGRLARVANSSEKEGTYSILFYSNNGNYTTKLVVYYIHEDMRSFIPIWNYSEQIATCYQSIHDKDFMSTFGLSNLNEYLFELTNYDKEGKKTHEEKFKFRFVEDYGDDYYDICWRKESYGIYNY